MASNTAPKHRRDEYQHDFEVRFRGAIIDDDGNEIPITEAMIQQACGQLENRYSGRFNTVKPSADK